MPTALRGLRSRAPRPGSGVLWQLASSLLFRISGAFEARTKCDFVVRRLEGIRSRGAEDVGDLTELVVGDRVGEIGGRHDADQALGVGDQDAVNTVCSHEFRGGRERGVAGQPEDRRAGHRLFNRVGVEHIPLRPRHAGEANRGVGSGIVPEIGEEGARGLELAFRHVIVPFGEFSKLHLILKLGEKGVLTCRSSDHESLDSFVVVDSFVDRVVDAVGAGDALLAYATLAMVADGSPVVASILGSMAAGVECEKEGNVPIAPEDVLRKIDAVEKRARYE